MRNFKGIKITVFVICLAVIIFTGNMIQTRAASSTNVNISEKSYTVDGSYTDYYITGETTSNNVIVDCGDKNVNVHFTDVRIDLPNDRDSHKAAVHVKNNSKVTLYFEGQNNYLQGGKTDSNGIKTNDGWAAIQVDSGSEAVILGNGKLVAKGGGGTRGAAAIGSMYDEDCGKITIGNAENAPTIEAKAGGAGDDGDGAAAIGSGYDGNATSGITINNGNITATGVNGGAGIGSGADGVAGNILITGGTIKATGGTYGAGIGAGNAVGTGSGGKLDGLKITGGNITAEGGYGSAGIGGSDEGMVYNLEIDQADDSELNIETTGGNRGAGIGNGNSGPAGNDGTSQNDIGNIKITLSGGKITAKGGYGGAGIGGGNSKADNIEIYGWGTINATGGDYSCAIGAGKQEDGGNITIEGPKGHSLDNLRLIINATTTKTSGDNDAAAIGGADSKGGNISISNAKITTDSYYKSRGAAIGSGANAKMISEGMGSITIDTCVINDTSFSEMDAVTIGAGAQSLVGDITINNSFVSGSAIGSTDNGNVVFKDPTVGDIKITGSEIRLNNTSGQRAAIGSGRFAGVDSITIESSTVEAYTVSGAAIGSGGYSSDNAGDGLKWTGNACGNITIRDSNVVAYGKDGGAGIGGGWGTPVGKVIIEDSTVTAGSSERGDLQGGAGIGAGWGESCGDISIKNSTVQATGAGQSAGIGSSGSASISSMLWNSTCHNVTIDNSTVTVSGGDGAAAIGTGEGAQFGSSCGITINDSIVTATGGSRGAGIGAGANGALGIGGEATFIDITGKSKIKATGGDSAAGIGGGQDGGCDSVYISLYSTEHTAEGWKYYVDATGGKGGAGIGSGGIYKDPDAALNLKKEGHDIDSVTIENGYVKATGGPDDYGAGAGIGGGARGGNINGFNVTGGYVEAAAGSGYGDAIADDIGTGGEDNRKNVDEDFIIAGGTVIGSLSSDPDVITITGGSVSHNTDKARGIDGVKVYRTLMKVPKPYMYPQYFSVDSYNYSRTLYSDGNSLLYLYLPESEQNQAKAYYSEEPSEKWYVTQHYYGTTTTDGNGWLKKDQELAFKGPVLEDGTSSAYPAVDQIFTLYLEDSEINGEIAFSVESDKIEVVEKNTSAPGAWIKLKAKDITEYKVTAECDQTGNDMYWNASAVFEGVIKQDAAQIEFTETIKDKVYDGEPVENPGVRLNNSEQEVKYSYYTEANKWLSSPPSDSGRYYVIAYVEETENYSAAETEPMYFNILKRDVYLSMSAEKVVTSENVGAVHITVFADNLVDTDDGAKIQLSIFPDSGHNTVVEGVEITQTSDGRYAAVYDYKSAAAEGYDVKAEYLETKNYNYAVLEKRVEKESRDERTVSATAEGESITVSGSFVKAPFGSGAFRLKAVPSEYTASNLSPGDEYKFELVYDSAGQGEEPTVKLEKAYTPHGGLIKDEYSVIPENAGTAIIKVTVSNSAVYEEAYTYVTVVVLPVEATVESYAYAAGDASKTPVTQVEYGKTGTLEYGLKYTDQFQGAGTAFLEALQPVPISETSGVNGGTGWPIGITAAEGTASYETVTRNYKIVPIYGTVKITPATLQVNVADQTIEYGQNLETAAYSFGDKNGKYDLMPWDSADEVIDSASMEKPIGKYKPGVYKDEIGVKIKKENENYKFNDDNGDSTVNKGTLTVDKGRLLASVSVPSFVYTGEKAEPEITVVPVRDESVDPASMDDPGKPDDVKYYAISKDGKRQSLLRAPKDTGIYAVEVVFEENEYYGKVTATDTFIIRKARCDVEAPDVPDMKYREGLTLADQSLPKGWEWVDQDKELSIGGVREYAVYTPEDTRNYYSAVRLVEFDVYEHEEPAVPDIPDSPSDTDDPTSTDDPASSGDSSDTDKSSKTGDDINLTLWFTIMLIAGVLSVVAFVTRKVRK